MTKLSEHELTDVQRSFILGLTDQRIANVWAMADLYGDFDADALEFLRSLGRDDRKPLREFLLRSRKETFEFLTDIRPEEVEEIVSAIESFRSFRRVVRIVAWGTGVLFAFFVGMTVLWDKLAPLLKSAPVPK